MKHLSRAVAFILAALCVAWATPCRAASDIIYKFQGGADGKFPLGGLLEYNGVFYGTTVKGGVDGYGTAFRLTPPAKGATAWTKTVLYNFTGYTDGYDGEYPEGNLIVGLGGALYGTTNGGGLYGYGTAFQLVPPSDGETAWSEVVIYDFCKLSACADGTYPQDALLLGPGGVLYGTTSEGGLFVNKGTVFKLSPPQGAASKWPETVLYSFCSVGFLCDDGSHPVSELIADKQGALYGTTEFGGTEDSGTAFKLTPPAKGKTDWTETVLHSFCVTTICLDGSYPHAGMVFDPQGDLYGTTYQGGTSTGGVVFKLTPPGNGESKWTERVLHSFTGGVRGGNPAAALIIDQNGVLYGTTQNGGHGLSIGQPNGVVFKLTPNGEFKWPETVLHAFYVASDPSAGVIRYQDALYGTTYLGGSERADCLRVRPTSTSTCGTVFKVPLSTGQSRPK